MQKEKLSALMDGESIDNGAIEMLSQDRTLQQSWHSYHLIRDTMRGDIGETVHLDIADKVSAALALEPEMDDISQPEISQPHPAIWSTLPFWHKVRPWFSQMGQVGLAACVSLVVIVGVQQYNQQTDENSPETPVFNTVPLSGQPSPVSFDVATEGAQNINQQALEQRKRINAILQDYELQRRLHAEQLKTVQPPANSNAKNSTSAQQGLSQ